MIFFFTIFFSFCLITGVLVLLPIYLLERYIKYNDIAAGLAIGLWLIFIVSVLLTIAANSQ
jgi:hypothetical protein